MSWRPHPLRTVSTRADVDLAHIRASQVHFATHAYNVQERSRMDESGPEGYAPLI